MPHPPNSGRGREGNSDQGPAPRGEGEPAAWIQRTPSHAPNSSPSAYQPPISALAPLFQNRLNRMYRCRIAFFIDINTRPTTRVLGGYYRSRRLIRIYSHDTKEGRRPLNELFDTFLHEVAHHLEYTEPQSFASRTCRRIPGRMHSRLFWKILSELKRMWAEVQERHWAELRAQHRF